MRAPTVYAPEAEPLQPPRNGKFLFTTLVRRCVCITWCIVGEGRSQIDRNSS
jgi:hypothetical protein